MIKDTLKNVPAMGQDFVALVEIRSFKQENVKWADKKTGEPRAMKVNVYGAEFLGSRQQLLLKEAEGRDGTFKVDPKLYPTGTECMAAIRQLEGGGRTTFSASIVALVKDGK